MEKKLRKAHSKMSASGSSTPPNEIHETSNNDRQNDSDCDSDSSVIDNFRESPRPPLHSQFEQQQQEQEQPSSELPLIPLALYPPQPRDETEARESFRRGAIDKAHETSALSWPEHIKNHDVHRFRNAATTKRRPRSNSAADQSNRSLSSSLILSDGGFRTTTTSDAEDHRLLLIRSAHSFHSFSARSTLRKRRISSSSDLGVGAAAAAAASFSCVVSPPILGDARPSTHQNVVRVDSKNIEIVAVAAHASAETGTKDPLARKAATAGEITFKGKGPIPVTKFQIEGLGTWETYCNRHVQLMISLALFSYLGQFSRYFIENLFGRACHEPETVGWEPRWRACTSSPGTNESTGGAFFVDLPTNIIGCFLMGLLVSGDGESISVNLPMAALPRNCFFQNWVVTHVGLRTGFCGALTTFASWNTQMVIMLCGGHKATVLEYSQWMSVTWGYLVGFYASLQSYQFGVAVAFALSRWYNPHLAKEADRIIDKKAIGVLIHRDLPDFERRFLHSIIVESQHKQHETTTDDDKLCENLLQYGESCYEPYYDDHIHHLRAWKETTDDHRHGFRGGCFEAGSTKSYVSGLHELEKNLLLDRIEPRQELLEIARDAGWDVRALKNWTSALSREEQYPGLAEGEGIADDFEDNNIYGEESASSRSESEQQHSVAETRLEDACFASSYSSVTEVGITLTCFLVLTGLLIAGFLRYHNIIQEQSASTDNDDTNNKNQPSRIIEDPIVAISYRAQFLSSLLSPLGTYVRWYLSRLNGSIRNEKWEWLPIGTLLANLIASCISALCAGMLLSLRSNNTNGATVEEQLPSMDATVIKAVQVGFAGSCSTVSTFCTETTGLLRALPRAFWGYYYGFGSMVCALAVAFLSYVWAVL